MRWVRSSKTWKGSDSNLAEYNDYSDSGAVCRRLDCITRLIERVRRSNDGSRVD